MGVTLPQAGQQATRENVIPMAQNAEYLVEAVFETIRLANRTTQM